jgi:ATP-binding cassette subfamily F protein 3
MPILTATDLHHAFGADELFHEVSASLEARDRVALVGPNGVGKTTLLLALAGLLEPSGGVVERAAGLTLGYLRQEAALTFAGRENSVYAEMLTVFADLHRREEEMAALEQAMAEAYSPDLLESYGQAQAEFEASGGYQYQNDIKRVLLGLGFPPEEWTTPLLHLSGGQKTRVLLGRLLLEKPALLILDEPTNHLDIAAIEWLESTLRRWEGALLIVSHDRYFLNRVVNRVWELAPQSGGPAELKSYRGNYDAYVRQRQDAWERAQRLYDEEKARLEEEAEFIQRHIAGGQTDIAKGRLRQLTRDLALIDQVGLAAMAEMRRGNRGWLEIGARVRTLTINEAVERIRELRPPGARPPRLNIRLETVERSARVVLRAKAATIGYPGRPLFTLRQLKLERGGRAALLGPNGSGKSTFLRTVLGELEALEGELTLGDGVQVGYFAQAHDQLDPAKRVIDELWARRRLSETEARRYLAHYLFRGDDVFKRVRDLSGGERGRLALALLALSGANFLLLDEPTNHLDIPSQEVLQEVLEGFNGTILLVSHDRYLVDRLAQHIWSIEDGELLAFAASYRDYLALREEEQGSGGEEEQGSRGAGEQGSEEAQSGHDGALPPRPVGEGRGEGATPPRPVGEGGGEVSAPPRAGWSRSARRQGERRRRALETELEDAEYWLAQAGEALEAARAVDSYMLSELEAEHVAAQERVEELLAEWELLSQ